MERGRRRDGAGPRGDAAFRSGGRGQGRPALPRLNAPGSPGRRGPAGPRPRGAGLRRLPLLPYGRRDRGRPYGLERRSPTGTRSAPRCARPNPTPKGRLPPRRDTQEPRRPVRLGTPASAGTAARRRFVANPGERTRSRAIPANEVVPPPACGGLCRLKPAFQAVPATLGLSIPARTFMPGGVCRRTDHDAFSRWGCAAR